MEVAGTIGQATSAPPRFLMPTIRSRSVPTLIWRDRRSTRARRSRPAGVQRRLGSAPSVAASGLTTTVPAVELGVADDDGGGRAAAVGGLHLRLHAATVERPVGAIPARRNSSVIARAGGTAGGVDHEHVDRRAGGIEHLLVVAGEQRAVEAEGEADARASADRRAPRPGRRSGRRRRGRSGRCRASRRRTRTSC